MATSRELRGDFNVHLPGGPLQLDEERTHLPRPMRATLCGFTFFGGSVAKRISESVVHVTCKNCRKKPEYRKRVLYFDADIRGACGVVLDWYQEHPTALAPTGPIRLLLRTLKKAKFPIAVLRAQPEVEAAHVIETNRTIAELGEGFAADLLTTRDLSGLVTLAPTAPVGPKPLPLFDRVRP